MKFKNLMFKMSSVLCALVLTVGVSSANAACFAWFHQPKVPEGMQKYVK